MYFIKKWIFRKVYKLIGMTPDKMPMTKYYRTSETVQACITTNKDGAQIMKIEGENYPFPGFPRSYLLMGKWKDRPFGSLSVLKHEIKNQIFNENWARLEKGEKIDIREPLKRIYQIADTMKYDMVPPEKMFMPVRTIYKAFTRVQERHPESNILPLRDIICFIAQEDDAYRFRIQFIAQVFSMFRNPVNNLEIALGELECGEVVNDMKARIRLLKRILLETLKDDKIRLLFNEFFKEVRWSKVKLTEADKYHFRPKWFFVDLDKFEK